MLTDNQTSTQTDTTENNSTVVAQVVMNDEMRLENELTVEVTFFIVPCLYCVTYVSRSI